jgi:multidrug efflux pump subunit AcrA (membrane-fusion protein)
VELEASKQSLVRRGDRVRVTLPDGGEVGGRIASVGRAARTTGSGEGEGQGGDAGDEEPVLDLTIALRSTRGTRGLDQAPVTVDIARRVERDVLAVPVTALLARPGGGYAVEVVGPEGRRLAPVETGFFADGYVAVRGRGVRQGTRVAVPS